MPLGRALLIATALVAAPALAQKQVGILPGFSDENGRQAVFNVQFPDAPPLQPSTVDPQTAASEFKRLCLETGMDSARIDAATAQSALKLNRSKLRFSGDRSTQPFDIDGWHGPSADVRIWNGAQDAFRKLPFFIVDSGVIITGPMKNLPPQCNLDVASTQLTDFDGLVAALTEVIGSSPAKQKRGKKWGQANWAIAGAKGPLIIGLRIDDLHKQSQTLHLGVVQTTKAR